MVVKSTNGAPFKIHLEASVSKGAGEHMVVVTRLPVHGTFHVAADGNAHWASLCHPGADMLTDLMEGKKPPVVPVDETSDRK